MKLRTNLSYRPDQDTKMRDIRTWTGKPISIHFRDMVDKLHARLSKTNKPNTKYQNTK